MKPLVPHFATMPSVISAWARCHQVDIKAPGLRGNKSSLLAHDLRLGAQVHKLSEEVFGGLISAEDLVERHTHVPLYASFLSPIQALDWQDHLVSGARGRDTMAVSLRRLSTIEADTQRRCPSCMNEDRARYGCAHWRLFHQWPVARHCAVHGDLLETRCACCRTPFARTHEASLADDACPNCGSMDGTGDVYVAPAGYRTLLPLLYRALTGGAAELSPVRRRHRFLDQHPNRWATQRPDSGSCGIVERACADWGVDSITQLGAVLGVNWIWFNEAERSSYLNRCPPIVIAALLARTESHGPAFKTPPVWPIGCKGSVLFKDRRFVYVDLHSTVGSQHQEHS